MRERGTTLGRLREWSPSPAWPEGRGLMLLRPMLREGRGALRTLLRGAGSGWIEDPANARFSRGGARRALSLFSERVGLSVQECSDRDREGLRGSDLTGSHRNPSPFRLADRSSLRAPSPLALGEGFAGVDELAATLICAAGHDRLPRRDRLEALAQQITDGRLFTANLAGARVEATIDRVLVLREAGEFRRRPSAPLPLRPGRPAVWDGRYEINVAEPGWSVVPALGRLAVLSDPDRRIVTRSPAAARGSLPVLIRDGDPRPVLAWRRAKVLALAPRRLKLAQWAVSGETTQEKDLADAVHGETPPPDLF